VGVELRAEAPHAVSVEWHADARVPALGWTVPAQSRSAQVGCGEAARCRVQSARRHPDARRSARGARTGRSLAPGCPTRRLARMFPAEAVVADLRRPRPRRAFLLAEDAPAKRSPPVGSRQRQEGTRVSRKGADTQPGATRRDGVGDMRGSYSRPD